MKWACRAKRDALQKPYMFIQEPAVSGCIAATPWSLLAIGAYCMQVVPVGAPALEAFVDKCGTLKWRQTQKDNNDIQQNAVPQRRQCSKQKRARASWSASGGCGKLPSHFFSGRSPKSLSLGSEMISCHRVTLLAQNSAFQLIFAALTATSWDFRAEFHGVPAAVPRRAPERGFGICFNTRRRALLCSAREWIVDMTCACRLLSVLLAMLFVMQRAWLGGPLAWLSHISTLQALAVCL